MLESKKKLNKDFLQMFVTVGALLLLVVVFSILSEYFLVPANLMTILLTATSVGIIAIGQFLCLLSRNFDMSVGNVAAMGGVLYCLLSRDAGLSAPLSALIALGFGLLSGLIVGFCVAKLKTNSWITTFAMMQIYRGILFVLTAGMPISMPSDDSFRFLGTYKLFGVIQLPIAIMLVLFVVFWFVLKFTKLGRSIYCIGGNPEAAHISGVNVARVTMFCFVTVGVLAALAGILFASRVNSGQPNVGAMYAMDSIAACVVGGTAMVGGKGNIWGAFMGVIIVNVIQNGLIMVGMDAYYQYIATGLIMFVAVLAQTERKK